MRDEAGVRLDQIEAVTRVLCGDAESPLVLRCERTSFGERGQKTHRWTVSVSLRSDVGEVRLSQTEASVDRPQAAGARAWEVPPAPPYTELVAALHAAVMRRLAAHETALAAAKAVGA